jgi:hypothetical protein
MLLEGASILENVENPKGYPNMFVVLSNHSFEFHMRSSSPADMYKWITMLKDKANPAAVLGHLDTSLHNESKEKGIVVNDEMSCVSISHKLVTRIDKRTCRASNLDNATALQSVPITEGQESSNVVHVAGGMSTGKNSLWNKNTIITGESDEGGIDKESMKDRQLWRKLGRKVVARVGGGKVGPEEDAQLEVVSGMSKSNDHIC